MRFFICVGLGLIFLTHKQSWGGPSLLSDHFDGERFHNEETFPHKSFLSVLKWKLTSRGIPWPDWVDFPEQTPPPAPGENETVATFINHATVLLQTPFGNFLTDPVYAERVSPVSWAGPKRHKLPGLAFEKLPKIDFVIVSHNHYDHLDIDTLKRLHDAFHPMIFVPLGNKELLESAGVSTGIELDWWQEHKVSEKVSVTLTPAQHWSARGLFDKFKTLWGSYVVNVDNKKIYFAGDTGYGKHFARIAERYGPMDLSLLPIGAYQPRWFMKTYHLDPSEAVKAHLDLQSHASLAIHFGTFNLTDEGIDDPPQDLKKALIAQKVEETKFRILDQGASWTL